jgi:hypothetical protein
MPFLMCPKCGSTDLRKHGTHSKGIEHKGEQLVKCKKCGYKSYVTNFGGLNLKIAPISSEQREIERQKRRNSRLNTTASDITRQRMSESHMGQPSYWKGKTLPQSTCDKMSISRMGRKTWNKGKKMPDGTGEKIGSALRDKPKPPRTKEHCENISKSKMGKNNPMFGEHHTFGAHLKMHTAQLGNTKKLGYHFPLETRQRMSEERLIKHALMGFVCTTPLNTSIRESFKYREWIIAVFKRDDYTCQRCKIRGGYLEAHHIKGFALILKENNIRTLQDAFNCEKLWDVSNGLTLHDDCHKEEHKELRNKKKHIEN